MTVALLNGCRACGKDFSSVSNFDRHRVGEHALDYPEHEGGRRCMTTAELTAIGFEPNERGRWHDPAATARTRETLSALHMTPESATDAEEALGVA